MKKRTLALAAAFALAAVATGCSGQEKEAETQAAASSLVQKAKQPAQLMQNPIWRPQDMRTSCHPAF